MMEFQKEEKLWNVAILLATVVVVIVVLSGTTGSLRQLASFGYVLVVPGMVLTSWIRDDRHPLFSAESLMLVTPLSFAITAISSLGMAYARFWHPSLLLAVMATAAVLSSVVRLRKYAVRRPAESTVGVG